MVSKKKNYTQIDKLANKVIRHYCSMNYNIWSKKFTRRFSFIKKNNTFKSNCN
jgi:hypothetical protein